MNINKNIIKLKIGQNSISNPIVKSKYSQTISTSGIQEAFDDPNLVDDYFLKGGYKVVSDITCRNNIPCEYRKLGMQVMVVGPDYSFKKYILKGNDPCSNEGWEELTIATNEVGVKLVEDYSVLGDSLNTQRDLNLKLKQLILNLQTQIDLIELSDEKVQITEDTSFANIGQSQKDFNKNASDYKINSDLKNQEQDDRLTDIEDENAAQNDLIHGLNTVLDSERARNDAQDSRLENLEGINYIWSPTNRTLTLFDNNGNQLSQVSLVSLDNEGTYLKYNASTLSLELYNGDNELLDSIPISSFIGSVGTQLQLKSNELQLKDTQGNILSTVTFEVSNISGLQSILTGKQDKLSSYDESILIENDGNIEGNVSLFEEYFEQQECELNFTPIQIVAVYQDGIKLSNSEYEIILPKKIKIKEYVDENIQIEYTHLKS